MPKPQTHTAPLSIAVLGVGKIGSTFAFQLAKTGRHDVTVVARPDSDRLRQLQNDRGIVDVEGDRASVSVAETLDETIPYDLVIVTLLAHQVDAVLPTLQRSAARWVQFMFVTFDPDRLQQMVGAERCSFGMPFVQATLSSEGKLKATIGAAGQKTIMSEQRWVELFKSAGMPAAFEPDMPLWLRCHVPMCVAFESVSVAGERRQGGATWREARALAHGVHESYALIQGLGYSVYPRSKRRINGCPSWVIALMLWSMSRIRSFRELLATGRAECRALVDVMVAIAPQAQPAIEISKIQAMKPS
ncbi:ketopantoate reductase family protein [Acidisphaera sp. L21]|uniref:ketopantoate reductase family protein n=1 Tax=Acidisphaera sp. L21 TaxID=1641851 RepID=UPI00131B2631|nr:2-dehydropantoate 2-reductase N-terminal domain-containing protein [Acidisphaera sp. L21]